MLSGIEKAFQITHKCHHGMILTHILRTYGLGGMQPAVKGVALLFANVRSVHGTAPTGELIMKLYRSALMAGLVAIGVGACGDDVQVVEPTPPPPPPLTAMMAPPSATVAVGNSVVFAVNASGGAAGAQASWTCASSNTGIATASNTGTGCQATGVAAGGGTITASVTKGSETVNVGSQLTVTTEEEVAGEPAFILITDIDDGDADGVVTGSAEVTISVERGDQTLELLSLLVDGAMVAYQSFGSSMGMAPPEDEAAEQAVHSFTLSFNSAEYGDDGDADVHERRLHDLGGAPGRGWHDGGWHDGSRDRLVEQCSCGIQQR